MNSWLTSFWGLFIEVLCFWHSLLFTGWKRRPTKETYVKALANARYFEEWEIAVYQLDDLQGNDLWRQNPISKYYDYHLIHGRLQGIINAREEGDLLGLVNLLRSGLVRNLGNITAPGLFNHAHAGTKLLIEDYITQVALAIEHVTAYPTSDFQDGGLTGQAKLDLLHDTRQAFGRSALVLQGGAVFGLCHIGVAKALHLRGLLPRIIVGTGTGALVAALVGAHTEDELQEFLSGNSTDFSAFLKKHAPAAVHSMKDKLPSWMDTLLRRTMRFFRQGYFLDVRILEDCVRTNVGDLTFEEAYAKTKRVLNITVLTDRDGGVPNLLNYLTAPNVLIRSAAIASQSGPGPLYSPVTLLCKHASGQINPWSTTGLNCLARECFRGSRLSWYTAPSNSSADVRHSPLSRLAELFNVNHFVVSQARPYIVPFLHKGDILSHTLPRYSTTRQGGRIWLRLLRICVLELQHRLRQLDDLGFLGGSIRRFLTDENIPGANLTIVPDISTRDFLRLLDSPTNKTIDEWILLGERSVWPKIGALKVRCAVEIELDRGYQFVRRRKPMDTREQTQKRGSTTEGLKGSGEKRKRVSLSSAKSIGHN